MPKQHMMRRLGLLLSLPLSNNPNDASLACVVWARDGDTCGGPVAVVVGGNMWWWWWPFIIAVLYMVV